MTVALPGPNPANAVAEALTNRDYISPTQIRLYQRCPLQWHFRYVSDVEPAFVNSSLTFGSAIHSAIQCFYEARLAGADALTTEHLLSAYDESWAVDTETPIRYGKSETAASLRDLAQRMLTAFVDSAASQPSGTIIGIEEELRGPIIEGVPDLLTRVDLLVQTDNALVVRDFKTSRSRWGSAKVVESAPQLLLYAETAKPLAEAYGLPLRLEFVVLTKTAKPTIETHPVDFDADDLARSRRIVRSVWNAVRSGHVYPNPSTANCSTCPYQAPCRTWSA